MNSLIHIFFAQSLLFLGKRSHISLTTLVITGIASIFPDLDHIPHLKHAFKTFRFGYKSRTRWHELYGLFLSTLISTIITCFFMSLGQALLVGFVSHYVLDLLTRPTRPFYPMSGKVVFLELAPKNLKKLVIYDTILTIIAGVIWIWSLHIQGFL